MSSISNSNNTIDPIILIRKYLSSPLEHSITLHDSKGSIVDGIDDCVYLRFDGKYIFPRDTLTNFVSKRGGGDPYSLDSIFFLVQHSININGGNPNIIGMMADNSYSEYMQASRLSSIPPISLVDRRDLIQYLEDEDQTLTAETASINLSLPSIDASLPLPVALRNFPSQEALEIDLNDEVLPEPIPSVKPLGTDIPSTISTKVPSLLTPNILLNASHQPIKERDFFLWNEKIALSSAQHLLVAKRIHSLMDGSDAPGESLLDSLKKSSTSTKLLPIIIVPNSPSSLLGMSNIATFLLKNIYQTPMEAKNLNPSFPKDRQIIEYNGHKVLIIDDPTRLSINEWDHVIAIFCSGAKWQFKGWRIEDPVSLFEAGGRRVGFSLEYVEDNKERVKAGPKGWNLVPLRISYTKRHLDLGAVHEFWEIFESKRKTFLK